MKYWQLFSIAILMAVCSVGCISESEAKARNEALRIDALEREKKWVASNVPTGATDITHRGGIWWTFTLEIDGVKRHFLWGRRSAGQSATETITELSQPPAYVGSSQ